MRLLNTMLLFAAGVILGFILKDRFYPSQPKTERAYEPVYDYRSKPAPRPSEDEEALHDEPYLAEEAERARPAEPERAPAAVIEAAGGGNGRGAAGARQTPPDEFFSKTGAFEGREVELELQMISARRAGTGWRLNLVHTGTPGKPEYLYVDDAGGLGEKPDLKVGYAYRVRFSCARGLADAGNSLLLLVPTGGKADWATGVSAVE